MIKRYRHEKNIMEGSGMNQTEVEKYSKSYLGDGVYIRTDGFSTILTTEDGISATNEIYLEPDVLRKLIEYCRKKGILNTP